MEKKTVLVIDDSSAVRGLVADALQHAGYNVVQARDGNEALTALEDHRVNLIICDLYMPNMDGITFVKEAKKLTNCRFTPVIMLTTEFKESKKLLGQMAGAKAWIVKPFRSDQVVKAVSKLMPATTA